MLSNICHFFYSQWCLVNCGVNFLRMSHVFVKQLTVLFWYIHWSKHCAETMPVDFIFSGSANGNFCFSLCRLCHPEVWSSEFLVFEKTWLLSSTIPQCRRHSCEESKSSASTVSGGINNGTKWWFPKNKNTELSN